MKVVKHISNKTDFANIMTANSIVKMLLAKETDTVKQEAMSAVISYLVKTLDGKVILQ